MPTAVETVRNFRHVSALVIGDAMLDSYLAGSAARLCTEGPVPVVRKTAEQRVPGGAANSAANLRALGAEVHFVGVVGRDVAGGLLRAALAERGVDDRWLIDDEETPTSHKLRILADGQYVVRFDDGGTSAYPSAVEARLLGAVERAFARCDVVVISDYGYGVIFDRMLERLRALRAERPCPLVVDSKDVPRFHRAGATVVTPNLLEARLAVNGRAAPRACNAELAGAYLQGLGCALLGAIDAEHAAITLGADGVFLYDRVGQGLHIPVHPVHNANDVGAGDTFTAALALALGTGAPLELAAHIAIDAAGIAVGRPGTAVVHHQELLQRVSLRDLDAEARAAGADGLHGAVARLAARLDDDRVAGRRIVFTNGVFDILHAGHVEFLRQCKALGDVLVVGVNTDASARRLKGQNRPVTHARDRVALVGALDPVDHVVLFDEDQPAALIRALRPHVHVKGGDYADEVLPEAAAVREVGGQVVILPLVGTMSTSGVIERIVELASVAAGGAL